MFSIIILSLCVASLVAQPFYIAGYEPALASPALAHQAISWNHGAIPLLTSAPILLDTKTQYHYQDGHGNGKYGYSEPTSSQHATHDAFGNKAGEFSYVKPDGTIHKTHYIADSEGYRVASNDLPVGPTSLGHVLHKRSAIYQYAGAPVITPSGYIADTPDVAAAKAAHFLEHAKRGNYHTAASVTSASVPYSTWPASVTRHEHSAVPSSLHYSAWSQPVGPWPAFQPGHPVVTPDGYLKETPEVAQAKAAHLAEKLKISKYNHDEYSYEPTPSHYYSHPSPISASYAIPHRSLYSGYEPLTPEGQVTETPEVVAAKATHFAEHAAALARNAAPADEHHVHPVHQPYYPHALPSDGPTDTPEVAQAKADHLAEYARVASRLKRSAFFGAYPASTRPLSHPVGPVVPPYTLGVHRLPKQVTHSAVLHSPFASSYQTVV